MLLFALNTEYNIIILIQIILQEGLRVRSLNVDTVIEEVEYINKVLRGKKRGFKKIALEDYNKTDLELLEEFKALGYVKIKSQLIRELDITNDNIEVINSVRQDVEPIKEDKDIVAGAIAEEGRALTNIDTEKLNLLLNNLDQLLKLVPKNNNCIYRNNVIEVRSLRVDTGLYEELKHRAESKNKTISELLNIALEQYFNNNN